MKRKNLLITLLIMILSGVFWVSNSVYAMPVGTLLYRTSKDGEMYGYNTKDLFQLLDFSLAKGLETVKVNCGHVGMYVGKIDGEDMVLEAIDNGVQLTPAKYFVDTREGEKLVGARIPKNVKIGENVILQIAKTLKENKLEYDWGFSDQKGPDSGQWICVGLTEKIYESLKQTLRPDKISSDNILRQLEYNPSKYAINITPDGFDDTSVYNQDDGDCLATKKEFSRIAERDWEPAYTLGKITDNGRYFFLPYTQFIQPTLTDVKVDIPLESDFDAQKIRGKQPLDKVIKVAILNTAVKKPAETTASILLSIAMPNTPSSAKTIAKEDLTAVINFLYSGLENGTALAVNYISSIFNNGSGSAVAKDSAGRVLSAVDFGNNTINLDSLFGHAALADEETADAPADNFPDNSSTDNQTIEAPASLPIQASAPEIPTTNPAEIYNVESPIATPEAGVEITPPVNLFPITYLVSVPDFSNLTGTSPQNNLAPEISIDNEVDSTVILSSAPSDPITPIEAATSTDPSTPSVPDVPSSGSSGDSTTDISTSTPPLATSTPSATEISTSTTPDISTSTPEATTTPPIATTTIPELKPAPVINNFSLFDNLNSSAAYSRAQTVSIKSEIENLNSAQKYSLDESDASETVWLDVLPANYNLSSGDGEKTVRLQLGYNDTQIVSSTAQIFLDTVAPSASLINLPGKSNTSTFAVAWQGSDSGSGIASYEVDYAISFGTVPAVWQTWLVSTATTSAIFNQPAAINNYIFFRVRAIDRAGNQGAWSQAENVKITLKNIALISQFVTTGPGGATDEFVELYNPGAESFSLAGWKMQSVKTSSTILWVNHTGSTGLASGIIPAHGFFLLAPNSYSLNVAPDYRHSANWGLSDVGGNLRLIDNNGNEVDRVSYGDAALAGSELATADFSQGIAAERKALATSTDSAMTIPGAQAFLGNSYDTDSDNNFIINTAINPRNSSALPEPVEYSRIIPAAVSDLAVDTTYSATSSMKIIWSSPQFGNLSGQARYILKYEIASGTCNLAADWDKATSAAISLPPTSASVAQQTIITGLKPSTQYCFALKTFNGYNYSTSSVLASGKTKALPLQIGTISTKLNSSCWGQSKFQLSHTVPAGNDRLLVFTFFTNTRSSPPSLTFAGQKMTLATSTMTSASGTVVETFMYYLKNPPVGTGVVDYEGYSDYAGGVAYDIANVDLNKIISVRTGDNFMFSTSFSTAINPALNNSLEIEGVATPLNQTSFTALSGQQSVSGYRDDSEYTGFLTLSAYKAVNAGSQILGWKPQPGIGYGEASQVILLVQPKN